MKVELGTQLDAEVLGRLRRFAKEQDRSVSRVVNEAIEAYLDRAELRPAVRRAMEQVLDDDEGLLERLSRCQPRRRSG